MPTAHSVIAILLILVLAAGFATGIAGLLVARPADDAHAASGPGPAAAVARRITGGAATGDFESVLEEEIFLRKPAVTLFATLRYVLFRAGNEGVVVGSDGWLYTLEELERHPGDAAELDRRLEFVARTAEGLRARGTEVVVALLPGKARIHDEHLRGRWRALADHPRYERAREWLTERGVTVADLRPPLAEIPAAFLERDTHWTPEGAKAAAWEVARVAHGLTLDGVQRASFETVAGERLTVAGDLMSFVPVGPFARALGLGPRTVELTQTVATSASGLGLFDTPRIPVTLVGTSYSADERWNFIGELKEALGMDVLNVADEGLGPYVPMADYLASDAFAEVKPALIVWEIPERYLTLPGVEVPELP